MAEAESEVKDTKNVKTDIGEFYDETGDIVIVSSDGKKFRTHSYHLLSASPVWRAALEIGKRDGQDSFELTLTDAEIEHSTVLTSVLKLLNDQVELAASPTKDHDRKLIGRTMLFLDKYDMRREILVARLQFREALRSEVSPFSIFGLASLVDDHILCGDALAKAGDWHWLAESEGFGTGVKTGKVFDISAMPFEWFEWIPSASLWALARASRKNPLFEADAVKNRAMGDEYVRLMQLRDAPAKK